MLGAALYIMACSARNRLLRRIRRLREVRYLLGAVAGIAYFYFAIFSRSRTRRLGQTAARQGAPTALALLGPSAPALAGLLLLIVAAASWVYPIGSRLLTFSPAERQILFAAPISRRQLLAYRLLRSQVAVLLSACLLALLSPIGSPAGRLRAAVGIWIFLMTCHLYFAGVTLARWRPASEVSGGWIVRTPFMFTITATALMAAALLQTIVERPIADLKDAWGTLGGIVQAGLPQIALFPFTAIVHPLFADTTTQWVRALPAAGLVLLITGLWVLRTGDAVDLGSESIPQQVDRSARKEPPYRARSTGWVLALAGRPETAFVWKGVAQTLRVVDWRVLLRSAGIVVWLVIVAVAMNTARGLTELLGVLSAFAGLFAVAMGPQILRVDLRQDLVHLELLKTWPVRSAALVRGELFWPALLVTATVWVLSTLAFVLWNQTFEGDGGRWRVPVAAAVMTLTPALVFAQYTIHNLAALLFPAWIQLGAGRARGVDVVGQRLILLGGTWLMLAVLLLPGAILGTAVCLMFYGVAGPWVLIPGAMSCTVAVGIELFIATEAMGFLYDRLDLTSVERPE